jgi:hypothetical protein
VISFSRASSERLNCASSAAKSGALVKFMSAAMAIPTITTKSFWKTGRGLCDEKGNSGGTELRND